LSETASPKLDEERTFMSRERKREKADAVDKTMDRADTTQKRQEEVKRGKRAVRAGPSTSSV
jgi:hypothetical protein